MVASAAGLQTTRVWWLRGRLFKAAWPEGPRMTPSVSNGLLQAARSVGLREQAPAALPTSQRQRRRRRWRPTALAAPHEIRRCPSALRRELTAWRAGDARTTVRAQGRDAPWREANESVAPAWPRVPLPEATAGAPGQRTGTLKPLISQKRHFRQWLAGEPPDARTPAHLEATASDLLVWRGLYSAAPLLPELGRIPLDL